jgi:E1A/CREB-binding protein
VVGGDDLSTKVYQTMEKHRDVFFTVLLNPPSSISSPIPGTNDPDNLITCDLMDGRDAFLTMARERHWEFSSLRRAKFSTMAMLYELHTQAGDRFVYNCNNCRMAVETRYHCRECDVSENAYPFLLSEFLVTNVINFIFNLLSTPLCRTLTSA